MKFKFPLPPLAIPSPPAQNSPKDISLAPENLIDSDRDISTSRESAIASRDPARTHPVFINSDLCPEKGPFHQCAEEYPVNRLNPVCMGYFNHPEYEIAMASIRAAEEIYRSRSIDDDVGSFEETIQHRRSTSNYRPFNWINSRTRVVFYLAESDRESLC